MIKSIRADIKSRKVTIFASAAVNPAVYRCWERQQIYSYVVLGVRLLILSE
jgi:hypothetical protein